MPAGSRRRGSRQEKARRKPSAIFPAPPAPFKAGDRVRVVAGKVAGMLGAVTARTLQDGTKSIHPAGDTSYVFVVLDGTGTALKAPVSAIENVT